MLVDGDEWIYTAAFSFDSLFSFLSMEVRHKVSEHILFPAIDLSAAHFIFLLPPLGILGDHMEASNIRNVLWVEILILIKTTHNKLVN